jgi:site-specific recombinase
MTGWQFAAFVIGLVNVCVIWFLAGYVAGRHSRP